MSTSLSQSSPKDRDVRYLITSIVMLIVLAPLAFKYISIVKNIMDTKTWMPSTCVIDDIEFGAGRGSKKIFIQYHYYYNDQFYTGNRYDLADQTFSKSTAYDIMSTNRKGSAKTCYVNPNDPTQSVINKAVDSHLIKKLIYEILSMITLIGMSILFLKFWRNEVKFEYHNGRCTKVS